MAILMYTQEMLKGPNFLFFGKAYVVREGYSSLKGYNCREVPDFHQPEVLFLEIPLNQRVVSQWHRNTSLQPINIEEWLALM